MLTLLIKICLEEATVGMYSLRDYNEYLYYFHIYFNPL